MISSATAGIPRRPSRALTSPSAITHPWVSSLTSAWTSTALPNILVYSRARRISSADSTGLPSSVNATAPPATSPPISANSFCCRPFVTAPHGHTQQLPAFLACSLTNAAWAWVSMAGSVFGMHATDVTPPATAAAVPVAMVSSSSRPGSRRWTCMSISPGATIIPVQSRVRAGVSPGCGPRPATRPSCSHRSATVSRFWAGQMTRPLRRRVVGMAVLYPPGRRVARPSHDGAATACRRSGGGGRAPRFPIPRHETSHGHRHRPAVRRQGPLRPAPPPGAVPVYNVPPPGAEKVQKIDLSGGWCR
jgi:hypothetical protein